MRRLMSTLLALCMVVSMLPTAAFAVEAQDSAEVLTEPIENEDISATITITTADELAKIESGKKYILGNDIDLSTYNNGIWIPISCSDIYLDGQGFKITNLNIPESIKMDYAGLFGVVTGSCQISNLNVTFSDDGVSGQIYVGGIVASFNGTECSFTNCSTTGLINAQCSIGTCDAGGLIGFILSDHTNIEKCYSDVILSAQTTGGSSHGSYSSSTAGGICGSCNSISGGTVKINDTSSHGAIVSDGVDGTYAGGLIGTISADNVQISNSYSSNSITMGASDNNYSGGLCGRIQASNIELNNDYSSADIQLDHNSDLSSGGLVGSIDLENIPIVNIEQCNFEGNISISSLGTGIDTTSCGGIVGQIDENFAENIENGNINIIDCNMLGTISSVDGDLGGIIATIDGGNLNVVMENCSFAGQLSITCYYGGGIGGFIGECWEGNVYFINSTAKGLIESSIQWDNTPTIGSFIGYMADDIFFEGRNINNLNWPIYGVLEGTITDSTLSTSGSRIRYFSEWDPETQTAYWGGASLIGNNQSVSVDGTTDLSFLDNLDQLVGNYVLVEDIPSEYGSLGASTLVSIKPVDSKFDVVEDIIVGNGDSAVTSLQFSNQIYAVVDGVEVSDSLIGEPLLYHLRAEEIVGYEVLDEQTGILKNWSSSTREIVIDSDEAGEVTTTVSELADEDTMSVLNGNTIQNPSITYLTDNMGFVYQVSITGNENPDVPEIYFNVDIYRANQFLDPDRYPHAYSLTDDINRGTPSSIYAEAFAGNDGFQRAVTSWNGTTGVLDVLDKGPTEAGKLMIEKKDIYIALILSSLQESTADKNAGTMEDVVGGLHEIFQEIGKSVKDELGIDIFITEQYVSMTKEEKELIAKKLKDHPEISPSLAVFDDASELLSNIMTVTKSVEDYCTMLGNNIYLATLATEQKELVEEMYKNCPASNQALKAALLECKTITKLNYDQAIAGTMAIASSGTMVSTCADIFWKASIDALEKVCPMVGAILAGYNAGKTASNILCNTDSITENYYKIVAMTELEKVAVDTLNSLENRYASSRTSENARLYLSMIDTLYGMLSVDCKQAYNMVDTLDDTGLNLLAKVLSDILGNEGSVANSYAAIKQQIEGIERSYKTHHQNILTVWVEYLPEDYPNSNLYDYYNALLSGASYEMVKQLLVACPVNVEIMDSSGNVVASVVDGRISASGNITVQLMGEQKLFTFYDAEAYQVQITGYDSGTMNVTVTEWNDHQEEVRHVYYTNIPVATNQSYIMNMEGEALEQEAYQLTDNAGFEVDQGYDTAHPEDAKTHTIQIENGYLNLDGTVSVSAQAFPGQKIQISALALSDQSLIRWDVTGGVSLDDPTALSTSFIMPDNDVVLYAVLSESELLPEIPDEPEQDHDSNTGSSGSSSTSYSITVKNSLYGSVKSDERRASQGDTVTLTLSPDDGYELKSLIVLDRSNEEIEVEKVSENEYTFEMPRSAVTIEALFALAAEATEPLPFTDVTEESWYYDAVRYAYENDLMAGTSATTFSPNLITTRAMIVTILYRLEGSPVVSTASAFTDVPDGQWCSDAIAWAAANNIVGGYGNGRFGPDDPITREQLAALLYRYAQYKGYDITASADLSRYTDLGQLSEWAQEAVAWANSESIISGTSAVTLAPKDNATRAQAAAMMMRFCENITP